MLKFPRANVTWWQKPLVIFGGAVVPAELAILRTECGSNERGVWLNSRGLATGACDLIARESRTGFQTVRERIPRHVAEVLKSIYDHTQLTKGCPDLVIWRTDASTFRLVEVKCPHWDRPSAAQVEFMAEAERRGVGTKVVEWEFGSPQLS